MRKQVAVILAGAVAKGAYQAGVLEALAAEPNLQITRLVAASSGALNAAVFASHLRAGTERAGAAELAGMWRDDARFGNVFSLDLRSLWRLRGLSSMTKVRALLRDRIAHGPLARPNPISLRILVAPLAGVESRVIDAIARGEEVHDDPPPPTKNRTTFEYPCDFTEVDFETLAARDRIIEAALASSAFPLAFAPVDVDGLGSCIDGGTVNNTPIKWAAGGAIGDALDAIFVVSPTMELGSVAAGRSVALINQVVTMLINERLYRDLREAERVNTQLAGLAELRRSGALTDETHAQVLHALGWTKMKPLTIIPIRPAVDLPGHAFEAFDNPSLRRQYIDIGRDCASAVLAEHAWLRAVV